MSHKIVLLGLGAVLIASSLAPVPAPAQTRDPAAARTLNGHTFIPSNLIADPFPATLVRTRTGAGYASKVATDVDNAVVDSLIQVLEGDLAFMALEFEYQHGFTDWLAVGLAASGAARIGTGAQSILAQGITSIFGFKIHALARVFEAEKWLVSGLLRLQPTTQYGLDPLGFAQKVIEDGKVSEDNSLTNSESGTGGALGVRAAYAPIDWLGAVFMLDVGFTDTFSEEGRDALATALGGHFSLDLNPLKGIPVGFLGGFKYDGFVLENSDISDSATTTSAGVAFTGRGDFSLSLEAAWLNVPLIESDRSVNAYSGTFNLRYYF